jgi:syntaxin 6
LFTNLSEVTKALNRTRGLYQHWQNLRKEGIVFTKDEVQKTTAELRNSIRSIEWDLEDLEDTIGKHFNILNLNQNNT